MKIAILGAGNVGQTLGTGWAQRGHDVIFGVRRPEALSLPEPLQAATIAQAAAYGDVIALVVPWSAVPEALAAAGDLRGKILFDCVNPNFAADPDHVSASQHQSGSEQVAEWAVGTRLVKIFNMAGLETIANPWYGSESATMFYAGDDLDAKSVAGQLASDLGFDAIDVGPLQFARHLELMAQLWGQLAYGQKLGREIAFRLLRR